jgi:hypothetical protein
LIEQCDRFKSSPVSNVQVVTAGCDVVVLVVLVQKISTAKSQRSLKINLRGRSPLDCDSLGRPIARAELCHIRIGIE